MLNKKIRVLIVDDSAFMRKSLSIILTSDPEIEIVDTARDGLEGVELAKKHRPDIITLDIEMPRMDGLTALKKIMTECPSSVIMVSSLTTEGAQATLSALELGAVDFISKEMSFVSVNIIKIKEDLLQKIKTIVRQKSISNRLQRLRSVSKTEKAKPFQTKSDLSLNSFNCKAIALGISTGGPFALQKLIPAISKRLYVPMFIVQHMPPNFTKALAERLNGMSQVDVKEAQDGDIVKPGTVYIAPGGFHMHLTSGAGDMVKISISPQPENTLHKPSVDVMMNSVLNVYGKNTLGVIMTGMGKDGYEAVKRLKSLGGYSVAQNPESCVVYGMPKAIVDENLADFVLPIEKIYELINRNFSHEKL